jgi:hypothetical protein
VPSETQPREDGSFDKLDPVGEDLKPPRGVASIARQADLFVAGKIPFPRDLSADDQRRLRNAIREQLRQRLVRVVARAIARDLSKAQPCSGDQDHVTPPV